MSDTPEPSGHFVSSAGALRSAGAALGATGVGPDMADLALARLGAPALVRTTAGAPSYWLVPLSSNDRTVGFVRVTADGTVGAVGRYGGASALDLDADAVVARISDRLADGETATAPTLVHDGPPGREAWMVVIGTDEAPRRCLFVTPAGLYERAVDDRRSRADE